MIEKIIEALKSADGGISGETHLILSYWACLAENEQLDGDLLAQAIQTKESFHEVCSDQMEEIMEVEAVQELLIEPQVSTNEEFEKVVSAAG